MPCLILQLQKLKTAACLADAFAAVAAAGKAAVAAAGGAAVLLPGLPLLLELLLLSLLPGGRTGLAWARSLLFATNASLMCFCRSRLQALVGHLLPRLCSAESSKALVTSTCLENQPGPGTCGDALLVLHKETHAAAGPKVGNGGAVLMLCV